MNKTKRVFSWFLTCVMLLGLLPAMSAPASAASGGYLEVFLPGGGRIGNGGYGAEDIFNNFNSGNTAGFSRSTSGGDIHVTGNTIKMGTPNDSATFNLNVAQNVLLSKLALSSTAQYKVTGKVTGTDDDFHGGTLHDDNDRARLRVYINGGLVSEVVSSKEEDAEDTVRYLDTGWCSFTGASSLQLIADNRHWCDDKYKSGNCDGDTYVEIYLYIRDTGSPVLSTYTCEYDTGKSLTNTDDGKKELLIKLGTKDVNDPENRYYGTDEYNTDPAAKASREWVQLNFNFSKAVTAGNIVNGGVSAISDQEYAEFSEHSLFTNTLGTGYIGQGLDRKLVLAQNIGDVSGFLNSISYRYTATYGDFSGNNPINDGGGIERRNSFGTSLLEKIKAAGFHDAAGNPVTGIDGSKGTNIFDKRDGGYDVIVDAVPPTYSRVGNGIAPDILTQLVLNENDEVDFIVSFSEGTYTKRSLGSDENTYLMLDNGQRAYFKSKSSDGKQWTFTYKFKEGAAEEASLLKVIGLSNDALDAGLSDTAGKYTHNGQNNYAAYTFAVDARAITDYVGNIMSDRANEDSSTNTDQIESSIGWAGLTIDNTVPNITFNYNVFGTGELSIGTDKVWGQAAKILASAEDPDVPVAKYDPDYSSSNTKRPSKGIYRPDNTTGSTASAVGLIFYVWTRNVTPPSTGENFEAIKRYSLTGEQPKTVTDRPYASAWKDYTILMANNFSDIIPPESAMTSEGDGAWYLHVWTADMTWDSARQLMQYNLAKTLQYNSGYDYSEFLKLKAEQIEAYRKGNAPSYSTAWNAIKQDYYNTVYTAQFLAWLAEGGPTDMYSDAAMEYAEGKAAVAAATAGDGDIYNDGYSADSMSDDAGSYKSQQIAAYIAANTPTDEEAWEAVRNDVFDTAFSPGFVKWLKENEGANGYNTLKEKANFKAEEISPLAENYGEYRAPFKSYKSGDDTVYYNATTAAAEIAAMNSQQAERVAAYKAEHPKTGTGDSEHDTTDEEAWEAVQEACYNTVYTRSFITMLDGSGYERGTDDAFQAAIVQSKAESAYGKYTEGENTVLYTAVTAAAVPDAKVAQYITDNTPSDAAAWNAKKKEVYEAVYTADYIALLDESGEDRYSEAAMAYAKKQMIIYNDGYTTVTAQANKKNELISAYIGDNTSSAPKDPTPDYNVSWDAVKEGVYNIAFKPGFIAWLDASGSDRYSDAAMAYARAQALLQLADYSNTDVWPLLLFNKKDSNWVVKTTRLLLDNTPPSETAVYHKENMTGDGTAAVELPFTITDALSGLDTETVYYQWVKQKNDNSQTYDDVQWTQVQYDDKVNIENPLTDELASPTYGVRSVTCTAKTLGNVIDDGKYILYIKFSDVAGNTRITNSGDFTVTVNTSNAITCTFGPEDAIAGYRNEIIPSVLVKGVTVTKLEYAVTDSLDKPTEFTELAAESADTAAKAYTYKLPALNDAEKLRADGTWYVHVQVYQSISEPSYFRQAYRLDRTAPKIVISPDGFGAEQDFLEVMVGASDDLSGMADGTKYLITTTNEALGPDADGWTALAEDGMVKIQAEIKGDYYLHILAADKAGNGIEKVSAAYKLRGTSAPANLPAYACQLLAVYEKEDGTKYGVANLDLIIDDKTGFRYSISTNGGDTWCNWLPYMSMIKIRLPEDYKDGGRIKVKFRSPEGATGEEKEIVIGTVENAIWAAAEFDSTFKRKSGIALTFLMDLPEDVTATPVAAEEGAPVATPSGANFTVSANGVYEFELSRGEQTADSHFVVVVDIFDDTPPVGYISYSEVAPTNGAVVATLKVGEPVYVKSLSVTYDDDPGNTISVEPKFQFSFTKNGTAVFTIADEAQNETTLTASVKNIDKDAPSVYVDANYALYKTVGAIASGATLEAKKTDPNPEDFFVVNNDRNTTMEIIANGEYTFIVRDKVGNVSQADYTADNIVKTIPKYTVDYEYVSDDPAINGQPIDEENPKQGKVKATVTFEELNDGRKLYLGPVKIDEVREGISPSGVKVTEHVSNVLPQTGGCYVYTRTYMANGETAVVVCDDLGNTERIPIVISGLDNAPPTLTLEKPTAVISNDQTKRLPELSLDEINNLLGGYVINDNCYTDGFTVTVARNDDKNKTENEKGKLNEVGKYTLVYTVKDPAGNVSYAEQTLIIIPADGLLIEAGDGKDFTLLSSLSTNSSILPDNHVEFRIDQTRMQNMFYGTDKNKVQNTDMRYDILYVRGLYREGQLKTIASKLTSEELISKSFKVTFEKAGWYTIIIRNQERTREYTTFFIAATSDN